MLTDAEYKEIEDAIKKILFNTGYNSDEIFDIFQTCNPAEVFKMYSLQEIMARVNKYEKGIDVGDVVQTRGGFIGVATLVDDYANSAGVLFSDGSSGIYHWDELTRIKRTIPEITNVLETLRIIEE